MFVLIFVTEWLNPNHDQQPDLDVGLTEHWDNHVPSSTPAKQNLLSTSHCDFLLRLDHASFKAQWQPPHWKWGAPVYLEMSLILIDLCFRAIYTDGSDIPGTQACCEMKVFLFSFSLSIDFRSHFHFHDLDGVVVDGGKVWGEEFAEEVACSPHRLLFLFL